MDLLPLKFFDNLPNNPKIQAATNRIIEKIRLGEEKYEESREISEVQTPRWADERELKMMIESKHAEEQDVGGEEVLHFRIRLMETKTIDLFEMPCVGYFEGTKEADEAAYYNQVHEKYEARKASIRLLTSNESCQTDVPLLLRKCLQTKTIVKKDVGCTVTEWDMVDSFKKMDRKYKKKEKPNEKNELTCTERFLMASQVLQRLFASNNFNHQQLIYSSQPCELGKTFKYTLRILWKMKEFSTGGVNHIATNPANRKLIAVGYGDKGKAGTVCIWNAKNPNSPEKKIMVQHAVTSTKFSSEMPYCLAAVTEAGDVLIVDVRKCNPQVKVVSSSVTNFIKDPLWSVTWYRHKDLQQAVEKVVTIGDSGIVMVWDPQDDDKIELECLTYNKVPHDDMFVHRQHDRSLVEKKFTRSVFQVVGIDWDPTDEKTYYASTTQGSLLVCKTSKILGPPTPLPAHRGAVLGMEHSPALPLVYLTYGADAKTFIWVHGVKPPLTALTTESLDPVICGLWSTSHCSVILTLNRKHLCLWDIGRSDLDPMTILVAEDGTYFTTAVFNATGTVVFVGLSDGTVVAYNLHGMPYPPYLQCKTSKILGPPTPLPAHRGAVLGMEHSPALPLVYLTYGADAKTFIWVHGVKPPLTALTTESLDPVICGLWSTSHCSVILTLNRKHLCLWDIGRSDLDPMTILVAEDGTYFTTAVFNATGTVVFVGLSDGTVVAYNLHGMPYPPYLQKNHLLGAFKKILWRNKALYEEVHFILSR